MSRASPAPLSASASGGVGTFGISTMLTATPRATLIRTGIARCDSSGAEANRASTRTSGQNSAPYHAESWALVKLIKVKIFANRRQPIALGMDSNNLRT